MNDLGFTAQQSAAIRLAESVGDISGLNNVRDDSATTFHWSDVSTSQSGIPLHWHDGQPALPVMGISYRLQLALKRLVDISGALSALVALSPFLVAIAIAIKTTSKGPVFFRQMRTGKDGKLFGIYKFRTMYSDRCDDTGVAQTKIGDDRVTAIGRVLRERSLDELPQLINVLLGDMSLVGPRPHVPGMLAAGVKYEALVPYYGQRHVVRPGITGWAQANGYRGPTDDAALSIARVAHDLAYIQNFSLLLDVKAICLTLKSEFGRGTGC